MILNLSYKSIFNKTFRFLITVFLRNVYSVVRDHDLLPEPVLTAVIGVSLALALPDPDKRQ